MMVILIAAGGMLVFLMLVAAAALFIMPKRAPEPAWTKLQPVHESVEPAALRAISLREQALDEDAALIAEEFRRVRREEYLDALRADAATYFNKK